MVYMNNTSQRKFAELDNAHVTQLFERSPGDCQEERRQLTGITCFVKELRGPRSASQMDPQLIETKKYTDVREHCALMSS